MISRLWHKLTFREPYIEDNVTCKGDATIQWQDEVDTLVVGFGGAGAAAAIESFDQGLDTLVIDRFEGGGATTISGGIYYAGGGTAVQKAAGMEDTPDNMFNYLQQEVQGAVSDETLRRFCDDSVDNYDWMVNHGVPFDASLCPFKTSYPPDHYFYYYSGNESFPPYSDHAKPAARGHRGHKKGISGEVIYQPLKKSAIEMGVAIQNQTKVVALVNDEEGKVIGVKALQMKGGLSKTLHLWTGRLHVLMRYMALFFPQVFPFFAVLTEWMEKTFGKTVYIRAKQGVILSTGGFYINQTMVKQYAPEFVGGSPLGTLADDGSGMQMAMNNGAAIDLLQNVSAWRFINPPMSFGKGVLVGPSGERICNEMLYGAQVGDQMMRHHNGKAWVIIDHVLYQQAYKDLTLKLGLWFHVMIGYIFLTLGKTKAATVAELADKLNIDKKVLTATIQRYNDDIASDKPDAKGKPKQFVAKVNEGPFYAIDVSYDFSYSPCASLTLGGLKVNELSGAVLNDAGEDIGGLYAAGRVAVGIPSKGYVSGLSIADCIFSGRRAARFIGQNKNN